VLAWRESQKLNNKYLPLEFTKGRSSSFNKVLKRKTNVLLMTFRRATNVLFLIKRACRLLWKYQISTFLEYQNLSLPENRYSKIFNLKCYLVIKKVIIDSKAYFYFIKSCKKTGRLGEAMFPAQKAQLFLCSIRHKMLHNNILNKKLIDETYIFNA
jgi:hypothetical protein